MKRHLKGIISLAVILFAISASLLAQTYHKSIVTPAVSRKWTNFELSAVRLSSGSYAKARQDQNLNYLLSIDEERMLKGVMLAAGMTNTKAYYGGWQADGNNGFGNYLSALSMMYASTGNSSLLTKINSMVDKIETAQNNQSSLGGYFYYFSNPSQDPYSQLMTASNNVTLTNNGEDFYFTPGMANMTFYHLHRIYAGIRDAYVYANISKAKTIFLKTMDWVCTWTNLISSDASLQLALKCEHGGIAELLTDAYALTNDNKYKNAALRWTHKTGVADELAANEDILRGKHGNAQDPKFLGLAWYYELTGEAKWGTAARNAINMIIDKHTLPTGGHGFWERYGEPGKFTDHIGYTSTEHCCTYNTVKFARNMINLDAQVKYMDFYERQLYNHIMGAVDPTTTNSGGGFTYYQGLAPGMWKDYMSENLMACCWETGIESHSKYGEGIYFYGSQGLLVNMYLPSTLNWAAKGFQAAIQTSFPENDTINLSISANSSFNQPIYFRIPGWVLPGDAEIYLNNVKQTITLTPGTLASVSKSWVSGDNIQLILKRKLRVESSDKPNVMAIFCGPVLLAADLGAVPASDYVSEVWSDNGHEQDPDFPTLNASRLDIGTWLQKNTDFSFTTQGLSTNYTYKPLYATHHRRFSIYSRIANANEQNAEKYFITDRVLPGNNASETAHNMGATGTVSTGVYRAHRYRNASNGGTISYDLAVSADSGIQHYIMLTYFGFEGANQGFFNVYVDNNLVGTEGSIEHLKQFTWPKKYFSVPKSLTQGKTNVRVKIESTSGKIASFYGLAMVTEDYLNVYDPDSKISSPRLEAERAQHWHTVKFPSAASEGAVVADINNFVQFNNVFARNSGSYTLNIAYSAGFSTTTSYVLKVNGASQTVNLPLTGSWDVFRIEPVTINLTAGMNTIRIEKGSLYADLDYVEVVGLNNSNNIIPNGIYKIVSKMSGKVMQVESSSTSNGGNISQITWSGANNQKWNVMKAGDGIYKLTNLNSGKEMDVSAASFTNGANIFQWDYLGGANQHWYISETSNGYYKIQNVNSGKVADVENFSMSDNGNISQYKWTGTDNQLWTFELVNDVPTGIYRIAARHSGQALEVQNGGTANGDSVKQRTYGGLAQQQWKIESTGDGYYKVLAQHTEKALDVLGGSGATANGVQVVQWAYLAGDNQKWAIVPAGGGFYKFIAKHSSKLLEVSGQSLAEGARVTQWQDLGLANQQWKLERIITSDYAAMLDKEDTAVLIGDDSYIRLFPNPARQVLTIDIHSTHNGPAHVTLINSAGQYVYSQTLKNTQRHNLSVAHLKGGVYYVVITQRKTRLVRKILITK